MSLIDDYACPRKCKISDCVEASFMKEPDNQIAGLINSCESIENRLNDILKIPENKESATDK